MLSRSLTSLCISMYLSFPQSITSASDRSALPCEVPLTNEQNVHFDGWDSCDQLCCRHLLRGDLHPPHPSPRFHGHYHLAVLEYRSTELCNWGKMPSRLQFEWMYLNHFMYCLSSTKCRAPWERQCSSLLTSLPTHPPTSTYVCNRVRLAHTHIPWCTVQQAVYSWWNPTVAPVNWRRMPLSYLPVCEQQYTESVWWNTDWDPAFIRRMWSFYK